MKILVVGASSEIAEHVARLYAHEQDELFLLGRELPKLERIALDLRVRGAKLVEYGALDISDISSHQRVIEQAARALGRLDLVLIAVGQLPDQDECQYSPSSLAQSINVNFTSVAAFLNSMCLYLHSNGGGKVATITSVAGDIGRKSNYIYGAAKGGLSIFIQGLQHTYASTPVIVQNLKPGMVDTKMTTHLPKSILFSNVDKVAQDIVNALRHNRRVTYVPHYWRLVVIFLRMIPRPIFEKLNI